MIIRFLRIDHGQFVCLFVCLFIFRHRSHERHQKVQEAANAGKIHSKASNMLEEMEALMGAEIDPGTKTQRYKVKERQARTISDDDEWEKQKSSSGKRPTNNAKWHYNAKRSSKRQRHEQKEREADLQDARAEKIVDDDFSDTDKQLHEMDPDGEYEIEAIRDMREQTVMVDKINYLQRGRSGRAKTKKDGNVRQVIKVPQRQIQVLVKWKGYSERHNTWEPLTEMPNALEALQDYMLKRFDLRQL